MIYFTADPHFCDTKVVKTCKRPFENVFAMNNALIKRINCILKDTDDLYILGDVAKSDNIPWVVDVLSGLNCRLHLIVGNHDVPLLEHAEFCKLFSTISDSFVIQHKGVSLFLSHTFNEDWSASSSIHLYGHYHYGGTRERMVSYASLRKGAFNIGVDFNNFYPVSIEKVLRKAFADFAIKAA